MACLRYLSIRTIFKMANIVTWQERGINLLATKNASKDILNILTKVLFVQFATYITITASPLYCSVRSIPPYKLKELLLLYHQFAQYRQELFYLSALHLIIIEVYIIEKVISPIPKPYIPTIGIRDVTALRCSEPLRYKVGGASKPSPGFAGWNRQAITC